MCGLLDEWIGFSESSAPGIGRNNKVCTSFPNYELDDRADHHGNYKTANGSLQNGSFWESGFNFKYIQPNIFAIIKLFFDYRIKGWSRACQQKKTPP